MIYKTLGKTGLKVTQLGFGAMRLPEKTVDGKKCMDWEKSISLLKKGVELGINFFDSHPMYCRDLSEHILGEALKDIKEGIHFQTKCPTWKALEKGRTWRHLLDQSLNNLQRDYIDIYIAHALKWETYEKIGKDFLYMIKKAKDEGLIGHTGFSSHDTPENVMKLLDIDEFESMTIQYNLVDRRYKKCIDKAHEKGLGVIVMGPVAGGILEKLPKGKESIKPSCIKTIPEMALRSVFHNHKVNCAISGIGTFEMLEENIRTASSPDPLSDEDHEKIRKDFSNLKELTELYCTGCGYCMPCPQNINIPTIFYARNLKCVYEAEDQAKFFYNLVTGPDKDGNKRDPSVCTECGECEKKCPQNIPIIKQLKETRDLFGF
jgi:uncharacterized protein